MLILIIIGFFVVFFTKNILKKNLKN
jgi:hypothetical protein